MLVLVPAFNDFNGSVLPYKWLTMCGVWLTPRLKCSGLKGFLSVVLM